MIYLGLHICVDFLRMAANCLSVFSAALQYATTSDFRYVLDCNVFHYSSYALITYSQCLPLVFI